MDAKELRIGNWLKYYTEYIKIIAIKKDEAAYWVADYSFPDEEVFYDIKEYEPIPLTPELLEKCGFEFDYEIAIYANDSTTNNKCIYISHGNGVYEKGVYVYSGLGDPESYGFKTETQYLHQLQNLYFALTGEELEIKELTPSNNSI